MNPPSPQFAPQELARKRDRLRLLLEVNNAVVSHLNLGDLLSAICACLRHVLPHDFAGLALYDDESGQFRVRGLEIPGGQNFIPSDQLIPIAYASAGQEPGQKTRLWTSHV